MTSQKMAAVCFETVSHMPALTSRKEQTFDAIEPQAKADPLIKLALRMQERECFATLKGRARGTLSKVSPYTVNQVVCHGCLSLRVKRQVVGPVKIVGRMCADVFEIEGPSPSLRRHLTPSPEVPAILV